MKKKIITIISIIRYGTKDGREKEPENQYYFTYKKGEKNWGKENKWEKLGKG